MAGALLAGLAPAGHGVPNTRVPFPATMVPTFLRFALAAALAAAAACAPGSPRDGCGEEAPAACGDEGAPLPGGPATEDAKAGAVLLAAEACPGTAYLCAPLASEGRVLIRRWRPLQGPLVVHVPLPDLPDRGRALDLQRAAAAGVRAWNGRPFPILVDERGSRAAHIQVSWVPQLGGTFLGRAVTRWSRAEGLSVVALELATSYPGSGTPMDPAQLRLTAAHEMGHALGLPHSEEPRDVMYPSNTATALSARDYRALEALYALEDGTEIVPGGGGGTQPPPKGTRPPT